MSLWLLTIITCFAMVLKDFIGIFMTIAEARANARMTAVLNPLGTVAGVAFFSFGAVEMLHHGFAGVACIGFVLLVDTIDGFIFTKLGGKTIKGDVGGHPSFKRLHRILPRCSRIIPAHDINQTIHLKRHYEAHHPREGDPHYHLFEQAKARLKRQGLWKCVIHNQDCGGGPTLHHDLVEFADQNAVDLDKINELLGLHMTDDDFAKFIEGTGNLEVLCRNHHLPGGKFPIHQIPAADWTIVRVHKDGIIPVEVVS